MNRTSPQIAPTDETVMRDQITELSNSPGSQRAEISCRSPAVPPRQHACSSRPVLGDMQTRDHWPPGPTRRWVEPHRVKPECCRSYSPRPSAIRVVLLQKVPTLRGV